MKQVYLLLLAALPIILQAQNPLEGIVGITDATCNGLCNGTAVVTASGGTPPYAYEWATPQFFPDAEATGLCAGMYSVTVIDNLGATITLAFGIENAQKIEITGQITDQSCGGGGNGAITTFVSGGTPPYMYSWSDGQVTPDLLGLSAGIYVVMATDVNGCLGQQSFQITEGALTVTVESDGSDPCAGPIGLEAVVTGGLGNYTYEWSTEEQTSSISVSGVPVVQVTVSDGLLCGTSSLVYIPTANGELNYFVGGWLNRGFCRYLYPLVANNSCTAYTGLVSIALGAEVAINTVLPTPDDITGNVITWNSMTIAPGEQFEPTLFTCVPQSTPCPSAVSINITTSLGIENLSNNVLCSYDPNDKQVSPAGVGPEGYVASDTRLTYMVRFQNTGTAPATFIHIIDSLDAQLDILSLEVLASSHHMQLSIDENHTLDFFFDNINLPDSTTDLVGSSGFVVYAIDMLPGLAQGTEIENTAYIYFDYNEPVITNTTLTTISDLVGVEQQVAAQDVFSIYPNPVRGSNQLTLAFEGQGLTGILEVKNLLGQSVHTQSLNGEQSVQIPVNWPTGTYMLLLRTASGVSVQRVSVAR